MVKDSESVRSRLSFRCSCLISALGLVGLGLRLIWVGGEGLRSRRPMVLRVPVRANKWGVGPWRRRCWGAYAQTCRGNEKPYRGILLCLNIPRRTILVFGRAFLWRGCGVLKRQESYTIFSRIPLRRLEEAYYLTEWDTSFPFTDFS